MSRKNSPYTEATYQLTCSHLLYSHQQAADYRMGIVLMMDRKLHIRLQVPDHGWELYALGYINYCDLGGSTGYLQNPFRRTLISHSKREISRSRFIVYPFSYSMHSIWTRELTAFVSKSVVVMLMIEIKNIHTA